MAAPAVTGEAAILAANFKDDKADKLAARIIGSVKPLKEDNTAGKSISGGLASVGKALDEYTSPVVTSAKMDNSQLVIGGFFFGNEKGKVTENK